MILNEFFNLPQVFEKDMTEGIMSEIDAELRDIVANEDFDALYELFSANTPAGRYVQDMYDDVVIDAGLHPDDDFERIEQIVFDRLADDFGEKDMAEGMFGSRPNPVLPIVAKIDRVARKLTPQNVDAGKQIIQSHTRDIVRILSPQDKAGVDVIEAAKYRDPKYKDQLYTQEPPDYMDTREYDRAVFDPKPDNYPGRKELPGGGEYDRTDPLVRGAGIGRSGIKNNILDRGKRKGLPSRDQITSLKQSIRDISGRHAQPNLPEQSTAEGKDDYVPPREANYDDKYQAMVRRVGEKARAQEKAKQQPPKTPVRESRRALLRQIIQS